MDGMHSASPVDLDVLIIGAGLSGIVVAWHLQSRHPQRTSAVIVVHHPNAQRVG